MRERGVETIGELFANIFVRLKRNRCANCFDCPMCSHTVSTRATSVQVPSAEDPSKTVPKKVTKETEGTIA